MFVDIFGVANVDIFGFAVVPPAVAVDVAVAALVVAEETYFENSGTPLRKFENCEFDLNIQWIAKRRRYDFEATDHSCV